MCIKNAMELSLKGETFTALKEDFDAVLARTIGNMEMKGADEATVTLKLGISLEKTMDFSGDEAKEVTKPSFKHDINSVMQVKDKKSGALTGDYCLVWDEEEKRYVMKRLGDDQISLFDDEDNVEYVDHVAPIEPPMIEGEVPEDESIVSTAESFEDFKGWIGKDMEITESMGNYAVRTVDGQELVLSSGVSEDSPFYCDKDLLADHIGHEIICTAEIVEDTILKISVKCLECDEELKGIYNPSLTEEDDTGASTEDYEDDATDKEFENDIPEYDYEEPEEDE